MAVLAGGVIVVRRFVLRGRILVMKGNLHG